MVQRGDRRPRERRDSAEGERTVRGVYVSWLQEVVQVTSISLRVVSEHPLHGRCRILHRRLLYVIAWVARSLEVSVGVLPPSVYGASQRTTTRPTSTPSDHIEVFSPCCRVRDVPCPECLRYCVVYVHRLQRQLKSRQGCRL